MDCLFKNKYFSHSNATIVLCRVLCCLPVQLLPRACAGFSYSDTLAAMNVNPPGGNVNRPGDNVNRPGGNVNPPGGNVNRPGDNVIPPWINALDCNRDARIL